MGRTDGGVERRGRCCGLLGRRGGPACPLLAARRMRSEDSSGAIAPALHLCVHPWMARYGHHPRHRCGGCIRAVAHRTRLAWCGSIDDGEGVALGAYEPSPCGRFRSWSRCRSWWRRAADRGFKVARRPMISTSEGDAQPGPDRSRGPAQAYSGEPGPGSRWGSPVGQTC